MQKICKSHDSIYLSLTARRLREKALPDEFRPEGKVPLSGQDVLRPEKEGMARYLHRRVRLVFALAL